MNNPALWKQANRNGRVIREVLAEFKDKLAWRADGKDTVIDIGCAGGDVTIDYVLPILPKKFERLTGVDISEKMIAFARQTYPQPKIEFKQFDIVNGNPEELHQVDHITSFYLFNWIQDKDQKAALQNIYNLLKPGGDCLHMFLVNASIFDAYKEMSRNPKWSKYMEDVDKFITPYQKSNNPKAEFESLLNETQFSNIQVKVRDKIIAYDDMSNFKDLLKAVDSFYERIPVQDHDVYFDELAYLTLNLLGPTMKPDFIGSKRSRINYSYRILVAHARKLSLENTDKFI